MKLIIGEIASPNLNRSMVNGNTVNRGLTVLDYRDLGNIDC